jgi:hypothetical protein
MHIILQSTQRSHARYRPYRKPWISLGGNHAGSAAPAGQDPAADRLRICVVILDAASDEGSRSLGVVYIGPDAGIRNATFKSLVGLAELAVMAGRLALEERSTDPTTTMIMADA